MDHLSELCTSFFPVSARPSQIHRIVHDCGNQVIGTACYRNQLFYSHVLQTISPHMSCAAIHDIVL